MDNDGKVMGIEGEKGILYTVSSTPTRWQFHTVYIYVTTILIGVFVFADMLLYSVEVLA